MTKSKTFETREAWLKDATEIMRERLFKPLSPESPLPPVYVSIGWPGGRNPRKVIGQYWHHKASADGIAHVFVSPMHKSTEEHLETLAHELVHACVPDAGHKKPFRTIALAIGLEGPMRSTCAGPSLKLFFKDVLIPKIGEIPHASLRLSELNKKKQTTRMLKCECETCGYTARTSRQWIETLGAPLCPCNGMPMELK